MTEAMSIMVKVSGWPQKKTPIKSRLLINATKLNRLYCWIILSKDTVALEALRAIKSEILLAQTASGSKEEITADDEIKLLQRLVKTRKESARIFTEQNRLDLAEPELAQIAVIEKFLPAQLSEAEVETVIAKIIAETGAAGIASMGKVMGLASAQLGGTAEGKTISTIVKKLLT